MAERAPIASAPISLVLVAHNAAADLEVAVAAWSNQLDGLNRTWEIILVDDASSDDTPSLADKLAALQKRLRVVHHPGQIGFGAALRSGVELAKHPLLAYATCDFQYQPAELKLLLEKIDLVDLVTGYRLWKPVPLIFRWPGRQWRLAVRVVFGVSLEPLPSWLADRGQLKRWLARWVFGIRGHDVECAFRLFRRSILARIPIQSQGPFSQVEILAKANFTGCLMAEVPVSYRPRSGPAIHGSLSPNDTYLAEALRLFNEPVFEMPNPTQAGTHSSPKR